MTLPPPFLSFPRTHSSKNLSVTNRYPRIRPSAVERQKRDSSENTICCHSIDCHAALSLDHCRHSMRFDVVNGMQQRGRVDIKPNCNVLTESLRQTLFWCQCAVFVVKQFIRITLFKVLSVRSVDKLFLPRPGVLSSLPVVCYFLHQKRIVFYLDVTFSLRYLGSVLIPSSPLVAPFRSLRVHDNQPSFSMLMK